MHAKIDTVQKGDKINHVDTDEDDSSAPNTNCHEWKEAILDAFRVMEKELKLQENIDSTCSGTTAVVVIRQVNKQTNRKGFKHPSRQILLFIFPCNK